MRGVECVVGAAMTVATAWTGATAALAGAADAAPSPSILVFAGTDLWRFGQFVHGGVLLSPTSLDADGFTLKLMVGAGRYTYFSGGLGQDVDGRMFSASALPGWRFRRGAFTVTLFAGAEVQDHRLAPDDPTARLRGFHVGARVAAEVWVEPDAQTMVAADTSLGSIGPTGSLRAAFGWRLFAPVYIGPEAQMIWCGNFQQMRVGAHVTGLRTDRFEWSAAAGWALDSDSRDGPYLRLGVLARY
jgi:hypothetical protein